MAKKWTTTEINAILDNVALRSITEISKELNRSETALLNKYKQENKKLDAIITLEYNNKEVSNITARVGEKVIITAKLVNVKYSTPIRWYFSGEPILGISTRHAGLPVSTCEAELVSVGTAKVGIIIEGITKSVIITVNE